VARITQRYLNGGHEVPISKVISRYYKSLLNAEEAITFVDRAYVYDNSIDDQLPRLLYRTIDGELYKRYTEEIPNWAQTIIWRHEGTTVEVSHRKRKPIDFRFLFLF